MSTNQHTTALALGSNFGDRVALLQTARDMLMELAVDPASFQFAPLYQTAPVDCADFTPDFYNTVVEFEYEGTATELLKDIQSIENQLGRTRTPGKTNESRTIDIDILYFGDEIHDEEHLMIPHPRMLSRKFVLRPLQIIAGSHRLPNDYITIKEHLDILDAENKQEPKPVMVRQLW